MKEMERKNIKNEKLGRSGKRWERAAKRKRMAK